MLKKLLLFATIILSNNHSWAQTEVTEFFDAQETIDSAVEPFKLPFAISPTGEISFLSNGALSDVSFSPLIQAKFSNSVSRYVFPASVNSFDLFAKNMGLGYIKVHRFRIEGGLGLGATISKVVGLGFSAYKGANIVEVRHIDDLLGKVKTPNIPKNAELIDDWANDDYGMYQTYGGMRFSLGVNAGLITLADVSLTLHNQFIITIKKINEDYVTVQITEEDIKKRSVEAGVAVANKLWSFYQGKKFVSHFTFNLKDQTERKLYEALMAGRVSFVQKNLPVDQQIINWEGHEDRSYLGVPSVAGRIFVKTEFIISDETDKGKANSQEIIDMKSRMNKGLLLPLRDHRKIVYQNDKNLVLYWHSKMNKARKNDVEKRFFDIARDLGANGFHDVRVDQEKLGSTLSQIGLAMDQEDLMNLSDNEYTDLLINFKQRCMQLELKCQKKNAFRRIQTKVDKLLNGKWEKIRDELGYLLLDQPALIYAFIKTRNLNKKIYFKFLSEKYQSQEGMAQVEI